MRRGFTLIELAITAAIFGILAAIALPRFIDAQNRAKRAELPANLDGIRTAQFAYEAANDGFVTATWWPMNPVYPGKQPTAWGNPTPPGWKELAYRPDGEVRGRYMTVAIPGSAFQPNGDFWVYGYANIDGDSWWCLHMVDKLHKQPTITPFFVPPGHRNAPSAENCF
ncbi:MAG: type II secretion system protein [Alphaproteobacteria bacterium]|nr:type II secretion system protein [Alphaproteobacteria bacterium]